MKANAYDHHIITKAIIFAANRHQGAIRKGTEAEPIPYIVHPMEAAIIVATMTNDPNVIAAALLHDVVEDTGVSIETIKSELKPDTNYFFRIDIFSEKQLDLIESYSGQLIINATKYNNEIIESDVTLSNINKLVEEEISILATSYESEPNDAPLNADIIYNDDNNYGYISTLYDIDYFKVMFNYNGNANFYLGSIPPGTDYDLYLYDQNLTFIAYSINGSNIDELISAYPVIANQWYYIKVFSYSGYSSTDSYLLRAKNYPSYGNMGWSYMYSLSSVYNYISSGYKLPDRPDHYGIDIVSNDSTHPIYAAVVKNVYSGTVIYAIENSTTAGNYVVVETNSLDPITGKKLRVRYLHMKEKPLVTQGSLIYTGTPVGYTGNTGDVYPKPTPENPFAGTHLQFDVNNNGKNQDLQPTESVNPQKFFPYINFTGKTSTLD